MNWNNGVKKHIDVSFVVPVYNTGTYLKRCIDSILEQNLQAFEVILVDDGSTDTISAKICDDYAMRYDSVYVIHKKNKGISSARNEGMYHASGDYICFVDSDDFFKENFANIFLDICNKEKIDIIRGWYGIYEEEKKQYINHPFPQITYEGKKLTGEEFLYISIKEHANEVVPWLGFFRRKYLLDNNIMFPEGIAYEEDQLFFLEALICDKSCMVYQSNLEFYAYRKRHGSATKTPKLKQVEDIIYVVEKENELLDKYKVNKNTKKATLKYICSSFYQLTSIYGRLKKEEAKEVIRITPFWMKWQSICHSYDLHQKLKIFLFTFGRCFVDLYYIRRKK